MSNMSLGSTATFPHAVDKNFRRRRQSPMRAAVKNLEGGLTPFLAHCAVWLTLPNVSEPSHNIASADLPRLSPVHALVPAYEEERCHPVTARKPTFRMWRAEALQPRPARQGEAIPYRRAIVSRRLPSGSTATYSSGTGSMRPIGIRSRTQT